MNYFKSKKISVLNMIKNHENIPSNDLNNFIMLDLLQDGMIKIDSKTSEVHITYFGFRELEDWDSLLEVSINNQLLMPSHGDA